MKAQVQSSAKRFLIFVLVVAVLLAACGGAPSAPPAAPPQGESGPASPQVSTPASSLQMKPFENAVIDRINVKMIPKEYFQRMQLVESNESSGAPKLSPNVPLTITAQVLDTVAGSQILFADLTADKLQLQAGKFLVAGISAQTPYGLLRKVIDLADTQAGVVISSEQAKLEDIIQEGTIVDYATLTLPPGVSEIDQPHGGFIKVLSAPARNESTLSFNEVILDADGDKNTDNDQVRVNGSIMIRPSYAFSVEIEGFQINRLEFVNETGIESSLYITAKADGLNVNKTVPVFDHTFAPHTIWVGELPVVITPRLVVSVGLNGSVSAEIATGVEDDAKLTLGVKYEDGEWSFPPNPLKHSLNYQSPTIKANASAKAFLRPRLELMIYGVVGPFVQMEGYLKLEADLFTSPWWTLRGGIAVGVGVEFTIFHFLTVSYHTPLFTDEQVLGQAPTGEITTQVTPQPPPRGRLKVGLLTDLGSVNDKSFNQSAWAGVQKAASDFGFDPYLIESKQPADYEKNIDQFVTDGGNVIITVGFLMGDATAAKAKQHPNIKFAIVDNAYFPNQGSLSCPDTVRDCYDDGGLKNVTSLMFQEDEVGYLAGVLAAGMSRTGTVCTVSGFEIPPVMRYVTGFQNGAKWINSGIETLNISIPSFTDPALGEEAAVSMIYRGCDVVFGVAGNAGNGGLLAAKQKSLPAIGVDVDQYYTFPEVKDALLSSAAKNVDVAVYHYLNSVVNGSAKAGVLMANLNNGGVGLAPYHDWDSKIPDSVKAKVQEASRSITTAAAKMEEAKAWPVVLADAFNADDQGWFTGTYSDQLVSGESRIADGKYLWNAKALQNVAWRTWAPSDPVFDFYVTVEAKRVSGTSASGYAYGLMIRDDANGNNYLLRIQDDNSVKFLLRYQDEWSTLGEWAFADDSQMFSAKRLTVLARGDEFLVFVNDQYIGKVTDSRLNSGSLGIAIQLDNAGDQATFEFDNFELRSVSAGQ